MINDRKATMLELNTSVPEILCEEAEMTLKKMKSGSIWTQVHSKEIHSGGM